MKMKRKVTASARMLVGTLQTKETFTSHCMTLRKCEDGAFFICDFLRAKTDDNRCQQVSVCCSKSSYSDGK